MAGGLVQRARYVSVKKTSNKEFTARIPDTGQLDIKDYQTFKKLSKAIFYKYWSSPRCSVKPASSLSDFDKLQLLGSGSFGFVALVRHKPSRQLYALKCMDKDDVIRNKQLENLRTEQLLLQCINYPFTIYSLFSFTDNSYIYIVLPYVEGGDLYGHLKTLGQGHEDQARFYASQMILALEYLHYLDFVYRDLKPENVLIDHTGYLKLADFGFTKRLKRRLRTYTLCGTPEYMAPEIILNKGHGKAMDWWAAGCCIYELVAGNTPFVSHDAVRIYENIVSRRYRVPKYFSLELRDMVDKLLQVDLSKRFGNLRNGVSDIKDHKWLRNIDWLSILNRKVEPPYKPKCPSMELEIGTPWKLPKECKENKYPEEFADF